MHPAQNSTMPPGEYWVGDPAIVFTEHNDFDWDQVSQIMKENRGRPWEQDGETVCALPCAPSKNGVWTYEDEDETQYVLWMKGCCRRISCSHTAQWSLLRSTLELLHSTRRGAASNLFRCCSHPRGSQTHSSLPWAHEEPW